MHEIAHLLERRHNARFVALMDGIAPCWQNTAQWARNALREAGHIRGDTPRGVWEITDKGREWLAGQPKAGQKQG